jgi:hypothetical protein
MMNVPLIQAVHRLPPPLPFAARGAAPRARRCRASARLASLRTSPARAMQAVADAAPGASGAPPSDTPMRAPTPPPSPPAAAPSPRLELPGAASAAEAAGINSPRATAASSRSELLLARAGLSDSPPRGGDDDAASSLGGGAGGEEEEECGGEGAECVALLAPAKGAPAAAQGAGAARTLLNSLPSILSFASVAGGPDADDTARRLQARAPGAARRACGHAPRRRKALSRRHALTAHGSRAACVCAHTALPRATAGEQEVARLLRPA